MIKEVFVIKKGTSLYYVRGDWRPEFSANQEDAETFDTYEKANKLLLEGGNGTEDYSPWLPCSAYQIEKWFLVTDDD